MTEIWKPTWHEHYEVSNLGRVRSYRAMGHIENTPIKNPRILKATVSRNFRYPSVCFQNKRRFVHELVATAFIGPRPVGMEIDHKNGDRFDARVENLEYVTHSTNQKRAVIRGSLIPPKFYGKKGRPA